LFYRIFYSFSLASSQCKELNQKTTRRACGSAEDARHGPNLSCYESNAPLFPVASVSVQDTCRLKSFASTFQRVRAGTIVSKLMGKLGDDSAAVSLARADGDVVISTCVGALVVLQRKHMRRLSSLSLFPRGKGVCCSLVRSTQRKTSNGKGFRSTDVKTMQQFDAVSFEARRNRITVPVSKKEHNHGTCYQNNG
jgi:hypothetical protein